MAARGATVRTSRDRLSRAEPLEVFTRPQRSPLARAVGLMVRLRAELTVLVVVAITGRLLDDHLPVLAVVLVLVLPVATVLAVPVSRRYAVRRGWCIVARHRLRATCVERRIMNHTGNVPLLLWARPTSVGDRVWMLLRAGIDAHDIERNLSHIASACWGFNARITPHRRVSALVVVDIIRRDPLGNAIRSPHSTSRDRAGTRLHLIGGGRSA